jgi:hypothetical protein
VTRSPHVQVLGTLSRGADIKTRRLCAIIIHSLAANKTVRAEMASRGAIQVIYGLSADNDMTTLYCAASSILRLSTEEANSGRLISEGGISAISNVAIRCADVPSTSQACAGTLHVLSTRPDQRPVIVQEGCIPALITMLRTSTDYLTLHYSVLAICNLLTVEDNQTHILQQGGVQTIVLLCRHEHQGIQKSCAFAIFTLSCVEAARKSAAQCGAIPVIISLAKVPDEQMQMFCAATLCMMSTDQENISNMVREGVIQTFIDLLKSSNTSTIRYSCAALCGLAYNNHSCMNVLEEGAVPHVVAGALNGDANTKQSCCAVISALSTHAECRQQLCQMNVLPALISLSSMDEEMTRLRCAVAFANLSCETIAQGMMVKAGVVPILSELSISYSEENQVYCAKALCNLATHHGSEKAIVEQGGMAALMMIGMVRTVQQQTKQICAKAILNLMTAETARRILEEGLVTAVSSLCKLDDEATMRACAYIFCNMSLDGASRQRLCGKVGALHGLFRLMHASADPTTKSIVGKSVCNLLSMEDSRETTVREGGVEVLTEISTVGDQEAWEYCSEAFFRICSQRSCRNRLIHSGTLPVIITLARSTNKPTRRVCVTMLAVLAWHLDSRAHFLKANGVSAMVAILHDIEKEDSDMAEKRHVVEMCLRAFFYLSLDADNHSIVVADEVIPAVLGVHKVGLINETGYEFAALALRMLSNTELIRSLLVDQGALDLISCTVAQVGQKGAIMLACAVTLYNLSMEKGLRTALVSKELLGALDLLGAQPNCRAVLSALLYILSLEPTNRAPIISGGVPQLLGAFLEKPGPDEGGVVTQNCCATVLMLSKSSECRPRMQQASLVPTLIKLSKSKNPKICDSASQALNCLSENSTDGIEEGTVAALIAIALDGNAASKTEIKAEDYLKVPEITALDPEAYAPGPELSNSLPAYQGLKAPYQKMPAGPAGKGPKPPKPPSILDDKKAIRIPGSTGKAEEELTVEAEEDATGADKVRIMMFAKMDLPAKFLEEDTNQDEEPAPDELKFTVDIGEDLPQLPEIDGGAKTPSAKSSKASSPSSRPGGRHKGVSAPGAKAGKAAGGSKHKGAPTGAGSKTATMKRADRGAASVLPMDQGVDLSTTVEIELKKPAAIKHGPKDKVTNFFETGEFLANVRMPHEWVDEPSKRPNSAGMTGGGMAKQKTLGEKAADLGLWNKPS